MNKNIKRTIAIALAVGTFTAVGPTEYSNLLFNTVAHASSSDADELTSLDLETSGGSSLTLYEDSSYDSELADDLSVGETYYAKTSSSKVVISSIDGADNDNVRIFKGSSSTVYEVGDDISISEGTTTTLKVRVYDDTYDSSEDYTSSDYNQYTIVVKNTNSTESSDVDLLGIALSNSQVGFNPNTTSYDVSVPTDATSTIIQAVPKSEDYTVTIDGTIVTKSDNYEKTVSLSSDSTIDTVTVEVSNDTDSKTYTLNINKTLTAGNAQQGTNNFGIPNQQGNGYRFGNQKGNGFSNGNQGFNNWNINNNGNMSNNGIGNGNGSHANGWQKMSRTWYYFDNSGQKKTGWFRDKDGKWYYLDSSGAMASNAVIDGYQLGADGAWIK